MESKKSRGARIAKAVLWLLSAVLLTQVNIFIWFALNEFIAPGQEKNATIFCETSKDEKTQKCIWKNDINTGLDT